MNSKKLINRIIKEIYAIPISYGYQLFCTRMAIRTCNYKDCYVQRVPCGSTTFFQLPTDEPRRTQWILNSGNVQLMNLKQNQKRFFCEKHFRKKDIKSQFYKKALFKNAVPLPYLGDKSTTNARTIIGDFTDFEKIKEDCIGPGLVHGYSEDEYVTDVLGGLNVSQNECNTDYVDGEERADVECNIFTTETTHDLMERNPEQEEQEPAQPVETTINPSSENVYTDFLYETDSLYEIAPDSTSQTVTSSASALPINANNEEEPTAVLNTSSESIDIDTLTIDIDCIYEIDTLATNADAVTSEAVVSLAAPTIGAHTEGDIEPSTPSNPSAALLPNENDDLSQQLPTTSESYESDKHFALSLVYHFQRLNMKKKAKAKIDILTYLVALEQDLDDAALVT